MGAFTLIEVLTVVILIGILSSLAYASFTDIIFTNRAKETAQTIRTFVEKSLADAKRQNKTVNIKFGGGNSRIEADIDGNVTSAAFSSGFSNSGGSPVSGITKNYGTAGATSIMRIGLSGIADEGYFSVCGARGYCGGAVKRSNENSFKAYIRKGTDKPWEAL